MIQYTISFILLGHSLILQGRVSFSSPVQLFPPYSAAVSIFLVRSCEPAPQLTEQLLHSPYSLQLQSTLYEIKMKLILVLCSSMVINNLFITIGIRNVQPYRDTKYYRSVLLFYFQCSSLHHWQLPFQCFEFEFPSHAHK